MRAGHIGRAGRRAGGLALSAVMVAFGLLMIAPIGWLVVTTVGEPDRRFALPPDWLPGTVDLEPFGRVGDLIPFGTMLFNSLKITTIITAGALLTGILAAYAFARLEFRGRDALFMLFLSGLMIPPQITVIPVFVLMRRLELVDTHAAVYLPGLVNALGVFLLRQYFMTIPKELDEAARMDGAGHLTVLGRIIVPLATPAISALGIFLFQLHWNDFFWPNIFLSSQEKLTLPLGLVTLQGAHGEGQSIVIFAAITMIVLPLLLLFLVFQRALVDSVAGTGLKE